MRWNKIPSGAKAREFSTNYGTAEAVPFQDRVLTQTLQPRQPRTKVRGSGFSNPRERPENMLDKRGMRDKVSGKCA
jgi:hypothetical protein